MLIMAGSRRASTASAMRWTGCFRTVATKMSRACRAWPPSPASTAPARSAKPKTTATRYYVSSARLTPEGFARAVRAHWAIENSLHWALDMTFDEDRARNRKDNGPENLTILRKLTLTLLRKTRPNLPISRKRKRAGWSDDFARTIIGQMR